ncbi:ethanolamine ammonia-lyase small subunit [Novosphingobium sp. SG751A]|uniref:ethanolamine ammonia-lyase subunit EutC n=1 Tax=Novosphingobium sp. SG751A TaxID=2587000 RepID=UPI00155429C8|nr:ethanolamine ammonia-lyase small subunit [Novosphingobium sp. SG751A]
MADLPDITPLRQRLSAFTNARVAIGRVGSSVPTGAMLEFQLAHARARDAVHDALAPGAVEQGLAGWPSISVHSAAPDRATYLLRPDLGRQLQPEDAASLQMDQAQLAIVIADGLSATATMAHGAALAMAMVERLRHDWRIGPMVIAHQARVALGDEIGEAMDAQMVVVLIGERPGLSAADSLSAYLTWAPRRGRLDSERNCISNIRPPHGRSIAEAADEIARILSRARAAQCTGVALAGGEALAAEEGPD